MSSLIRRLAIRAMKRAGYTREKWIIGKDVRGNPMPIAVRHGGEITDPDDTPIGRHWPMPVPERARPQRNVGRANRHHVIPHALRRSKNSQKWLEERAHAALAKARGEA